VVKNEKDKLLFELRAALEAIRFYRSKVKNLKAEMKNVKAADADYTQLVQNGKGIKDYGKHA
jgi:hypothetical protein